MLLNWPTAALIFALVALLALRKQLAQLLERTEKVKDWLVAPRQSPDKGEGQADTLEAQKAFERLTRGLDNQLLALQDEAIEADLIREGLKVQSATERVLMRHLSGAQLAYRFERLSSIIYASQLQALRWLNSQPAEVEDEALRPFYDFAAKQFRPLYAGLAFEDWFDFFVRYELMTNPESHEGLWLGYQITHFGRGYLRYLVDSGRVEPILG